MSFREAAEAFIGAKKAGWSNAKHAGQWTATLTNYAFPNLGDRRARDISTDDVLAVLTPLWTTKAETANRVRGRIESALDYAATREGWKNWTNPAKWRGRLEYLLAAGAKVAPVEHHAALPYVDLSGFIADLRNREGNAARALEFCILTAARCGMVLGAVWSEIDLVGRVWTIPAARMKGRRPHRVPLSEAAASVLESMHASRDPERGDWVFPGDKPGKPYSDMAMTAVLRRMGRGQFSVHGFRSTFADWRAEATQHPEDLQEAALAHMLGGKTLHAYQRGDQLEKRRALMRDWAAYCEATCNSVPTGQQSCQFSA